MRNSTPFDFCFDESVSAAKRIFELHKITLYDYVVVIATSLSSIAPISPAGAFGRALRHGIAWDSSWGQETGLVALVGRGLCLDGNPGIHHSIDVAAVGFDVRNLRILARMPGGK
jgi:hypothetical protein